MVDISVQVHDNNRRMMGVGGGGRGVGGRAVEVGTRDKRNQQEGC